MNTGLIGNGLLAILLSIVLTACNSKQTASTFEGTQTRALVTNTTKITKRSGPSKRVHSQRQRSVSQANPRKKTYLGSAAYICSPSGFGRNSACFAREN